MNSDECKEKLTALALGELSPEDSIAVLEAIEQYPDCMEEFIEISEAVVTAKVHAGQLDEVAPLSTKSKADIVELAEQMESKHKKNSWLIVNLSRVVAVAAGLIFGFFLLNNLFHKSESEKNNEYTYLDTVETQKSKESKKQVAPGKSKESKKQARPVVSETLKGDSKMVQEKLIKLEKARGAKNRDEMAFKGKMITDAEAEDLADDADHKVAKELEERIDKGESIAKTVAQKKVAKKKLRSLSKKKELVKKDAPESARRFKALAVQSTKLKDIALIEIDGIAVNYQKKACVKKGDMYYVLEKQPLWKKPHLGMAIRVELKLVLKTDSLKMTNENNLISAELKRVIPAK